MSTFFVHHRSPHHAKNSGYNRILDYYPEATGIVGESSVPYRIARMLASMHNQKAGLYNSDSLFKDIELFRKLRIHKHDSNIVHYLNAERDIRHVVNRKKHKKNIRFCGTFHKPPDILDWRISQPTYVQHLHGAIAVGANQVDYIKERLNISNVVYIPHGIDTHFFKPDIEARKSNRLLFVGQHLRDFEALNYCVSRIAQKVKDLSVHVLVHPAYKKKIDPHKCISVFSDLNDLELKKQYHEASVLFLPMINSTACNSILEALACGLPIVTTDVGGNATYLEGTNSVLVPKTDYDTLIEATITLLNDDALLKERSLLARAKAESYDWQLIVAQIKAFHKSL